MRWLALVVFAAACSSSTSPLPDAALPDPDSGIVMSTGLRVPDDLIIETVANVPLARELAALPNGDLLVATLSPTVWLVPNAETEPGDPVQFLTFPDNLVHSVIYEPSVSKLFFGGHTGVWSAPYTDGDRVGQAATMIGPVRVGPPAQDIGHVTTTVGFAGGRVFASVGSSCNACVEMDPTRAAITGMDPDGSNPSKRANRMRNAIAVSTNPDTGTLWAGGAGQDLLPEGHPYEYFDPVGLHAGVADYGWPDCEENRNDYGSGADCSQVVIPLVETPAYSSLIGAAFYSQSQMGAHVLPAAWRGLYLTAHGSWHQENGVYVVPPRVMFVPMNGDAPAIPVDWNDPTKQWIEVVGGFQLADGVTRIGRPTGVTVGAQGSLFIGDDNTGNIYRVRPR
jgi:glucose/arabinose dehydrogenase